MRRPPLPLVLVAMLVLAVGTTASALLGTLRPEAERYARARVAANASVHGLTGSAEYDAEVADRTVFAFEAGLSFLHTHAGGLGPLVLLAGTLVATLVPGRRRRAVLHVLLSGAALFPFGYLVYALAAVEWGREAGVELAQRWVLTPLGSAAIVALLALAAALRARRGTSPVA